MGSVSAVINQPYYFPQLHWWNRSVNCDVLILLDDVTHNTNFPINRSLMFDGEKDQYFTIPISKKQRRNEINNIIVKNSNWIHEHENRFRAYYSHYEYFDEALQILVPVLNYFKSDRDLLSVLMDSIQEINYKYDKILPELDKEPIYLSSEFNLNNGFVKNERLIELCKKVNADTLILGNGSKNYVEHELDKYIDNGITIKFQDWKCPVDNYSILHTIAKYGLDQTRNIINAS